MTPCHAKQCAEQMPSGIPFCLNHWRMLPKDMTKKLLKPKSSEAYYEAAGAGDWVYSAQGG